MQLVLPSRVAAVPADGSRRASIDACNAMMRARPRWALGATGPEAYFCWSMLQALQLAVFGRHVRNAELGSTGDEAADIAIGFMKSGAARDQWRRRMASEKPAHGDGVRLTHLEHHAHVGVWFDIERGLIAHLLQAGGFALDTPAVLASRGYRARFYEWIGGEAR